MGLFTWRGRGILVFEVLFVMLFSVAVFAQEMEKPGVVVYVVGDIPDNEKKILGKYLLTAFINDGSSVDADGSGAFLAAIAEEQTKRGNGTVGKSRICELGRQFNIRYLCVVSVTPAFGFFEVIARMVDAETEDVIFRSEVQSPLKTIEDLTQVSDKVVEDMLGAQAEHKSTSPQIEESGDNVAGNGHGAVSKIKSLSEIEQAAMANAAAKSATSATSAASKPKVASYIQARENYRDSINNANKVNTVPQPADTAVYYIPGGIVSKPIVISSANKKAGYMKKVFAVAGVGGTATSLIVAKYTNNEFVIGAGGAGGFLLVCLVADMVRLALKPRNVSEYKSQNSAINVAEHLQIGASLDGNTIYAGLRFDP
jgi:hypothetical protein